MLTNGIWFSKTFCGTSISLQMSAHEVQLCVTAVVSFICGILI